MKGTHVVKIQKTRLSNSKTKYWDYVFSHNKQNDEGEFQESTQANPDNLSEDALDFFKRGDNSSAAMQLLWEAVDTLNENQKRIYTWYYRDGYTHMEIANRLNISRPNVSKAMKRALANIKKYCREHSTDNENE